MALELESQQVLVYLRLTINEDLVKKFCPIINIIQFFPDMPLPRKLGKKLGTQPKKAKKSWITTARHEDAVAWGYARGATIMKWVCWI